VSASAAFLSLQQPNPVVVPSTPPVLRVLRRPLEPGQYSSAAFAELCDHHGVVQSMGRVGDSLDNAVAESFFATLKRELGGRWAGVEQARLAVFSWVAFYNHRRRHSTLGYHSPVDYERITAHQQPDAA
jgi:transposase InsO family protein